MSRKDVIEITLLKDDVRKEAKSMGLNEEQYIAHLKECNEKDTGYKHDFDIVDDWRAAPPGYDKKYRIRRTVKGRDNFVVGIPSEVVKREASKRNMAIDQFIKDFIVVAVFNESGYITYRFKKIFRG